MCNETSNDSRFDEIRPYRDDEVPEVVARILSNNDVVDSIIDFQLKNFKFKFLKFLVKPILKYYVKKKFGKIKTIDEIFNFVANFMEKMVKNTTDGVKFEGFEKLKKGVGYLFISNHRDIALDPALVDLGLHYQGIDKVRIAIGDNLLRRQVVTEIMKLNQSFIVNRSAKGRELLKALATLSDYISLSLKENHSIWIAQREGRAKDGNDLTEPAILKMLYMAGRTKKIPFNEYIKQLNIVPIVISYEFDPGDKHKAHELYCKQKDGDYQKSEFEDIDSIIAGIIGYKGRICVRVGDPITDDFETPELLAEHIDNFIHKNYQLFPTNLVASGVEGNITEEDKAKFAKRYEGIQEEEKSILVNTYAKPYFNSLKK